MSDLQIYLARNNQQAGPFSLDEVNNMLSSQQVLLTDLMWHSGMNEWKAIGEMTQGALFYSPYNTTAPFSPQTNYQAISESQFTPHSEQSFKLASVGKRIIAKLVDWFILFIPQMILYSTFIDAALINKIMTATTSAQQNQILLEFTQNLPNWVNLAALGYTLFILFIQSDLLRRSGQTIGKKLFKLQIVDIESNQVVSSGRSFFKRSFLFFMIFEFGQLFPLLLIILLVDLFMLFSKQNLTLHDRFAKTKVVDIAQ